MSIRAVAAVLAVGFMLGAGTTMRAGVTQRTKSETKPAAPARPATPRPVPYAPGESLDYDVSWSSLTAGTATVTVREKRSSFGSTAYHVVAEGRSTSWVARLYPLYYKAETLLDVFTVLSQRWSLYTEEGRRRRTTALRFDRMSQLGHFEVTTATVVRKQLKLPNGVQDPLAALFALRTLALRAGLAVTIPVANGDELYDVRITVGKREAIVTPLGERQAWRVTPVVHDPNGTSEVRGLAVWISDDSARLPLRIEAEMPVGQVVITLRSARSN
jgi:hypothetical protein